MVLEGSDQEGKRRKHEASGRATSPQRSKGRPDGWKVNPASYWGSR